MSCLEPLFYSKCLGVWRGSRGPEGITTPERSLILQGSGSKAGGAPYMCQVNSHVTYHCSRNDHTVK
eukprot:1709562-Amphidinium_carterae.1